MRVLLIWNEIPEYVRFFDLKDLSPVELTVLKNANGVYINMDKNYTKAQENAIDHVNAALSKVEHCASYTEISTEWFARWRKKEIKEADLPSAGAFDQVFSCGFIM